MLSHRLVALGIGGRTVRELHEGPDANSEGMDWDEFMRWAAFLQMEPPAEQRMDALTAMLMAQQHNIHRGKKRSRRPADFVPVWFRPPRPEMSIDQLRAAMRMHVVAMGGSLEGLDD